MYVHAQAAYCEEGLRKFYSEYLNCSNNDFLKFYNAEAFIVKSGAIMIVSFAGTNPWDWQM